MTLICWPFSVRTTVDDIVLLHTFPYEPQLITLFCCTLFRTDPRWWHCFVAPFPEQTPVDYIVLSHNFLYRPCWLHYFVAPFSVQTPIDYIVYLPLYCTDPVDYIVLSQHFLYRPQFMPLLCRTLSRTNPRWLHCFVAPFPVQTTVDAIVLLHHLTYRPSVDDITCCTFCRTDPGWWHCFVAPSSCTYPSWWHCFGTVIPLQTPVDNIVLLHPFPSSLTQAFILIDFTVYSYMQTFHQAVASLATNIPVTKCI